MLQLVSKLLVGFVVVPGAQDTVFSIEYDKCWCSICWEAKLLYPLIYHHLMACGLGLARKININRSWQLENAWHVAAILRLFYGQDSFFIFRIKTIGKRDIRVALIHVPLIKKPV